MAPDKTNQDPFQSDFHELLAKIGLPAALDCDAHIIRPSSLQLTSDHMNEAIHRLDLDLRLQRRLRESFAREIVNPAWLSDERGAVFIDYHLPETIGALKACLASAAAHMSEDGISYKAQLPADDPARMQKAPTSRYMPTIYAELFKAFNRVLANEGLPSLQRPSFRRAKALTARRRPECG